VGTYRTAVSGCGGTAWLATNRKNRHR
jgi:hypothetical protein